ncbi:MAG: NADH-quinone oxidoreductase subunit N, partial [Opitutaceae bacterium]|nr:NADH-quinone oxidoreductase subunit N [Opitutaceae bacterium]
ATAVAIIAASIVSLHQEALLFSGAYRVDLFSQWLKLFFGVGYLCVLLLGGSLEDIRRDVKPEYFLLLSCAMLGLLLLVSCVELIALVIALELSSYPLFLLVAMRRERAGQKAQMESAMKYMMFGVAANGVMLFGLSYLFGLTGTTMLPDMIARISPLMSAGHPLAISGLALALAGLYYKLAIFPFHFWTPDVYQGASNVTAGLVASLPKVAGVAILVRMVAAATETNTTIATILAVLAGASMLYGNLTALMQKDVKRLLGFSAIAHAGYSLMGFVALDAQGFAASLYYTCGYVLMVLACFVVIARVSRDGSNLAIEELAGLHKRSWLLALTLLVGVFALAGIPPFVGFMGKLTLLTAALNKGYLALVVFAVVNTAIAIYYYLRLVKEAFFRDPVETAPISLDWSTRALCVILLVGIVALGVKPAFMIDAIAKSLAWVKPVAAVAAQ